MINIKKNKDYISKSEIKQGKQEKLYDYWNAIMLFIIEISYAVW